MADSHEIFLAPGADQEEAAAQVAAVLGLEFKRDFRSESGELSSVGRDAQAAEARLAFGVIVGALPDVPALLAHNVEFLVAAYLPGRGTLAFESGTTLDDPDLDICRPWVVIDVDE